MRTYQNLFFQKNNDDELLRTCIELLGDNRLYLYKQRKDADSMFFHKKDKDVRLTDEEYKRLVGGMTKKERKNFDRRQKDLRREREGDMLDAWLDFEDDMDDRGL